MNRAAKGLAELVKLGYATPPSEVADNAWGPWCLPASIALAGLMGIMGLLGIMAAHAAGWGQYDVVVEIVHLGVLIWSSSMWVIAVAGVSATVKFYLGHTEWCE